MSLYTIPTGGTTDLTLGLRYIRSIHVRESAGTPAAFKIIFANGSGGALQIVAEGPASGMWDFAPPTPYFFPLGVFITSSTGTWTGTIEGY